MTTQDAFSAVIRRSDAGTLIDRATQTLVPAPSTSRFPWKRHYYVVSHDRSGKAEARGQVIVTLEDHARGWTFQLKVEYLARAAADGLPRTVAEKIVRGLGVAQGPQAAFEARLRGSVADWVQVSGGLERFLRTFDGARNDLVHPVTEGLAREFGLDVSLRVAVTTDGEFQRIVTIKEEFPTEIADYSGTLRIALHVDLEAVPGLLPYAMHGRLGELSAETVAEARRHAKSLTLQDVHFDVERVEGDLRNRLLAVVREHGRTVSALSLRCPSPITQPILRTERVSPAPFVFQRVEYPHPITVTCELQVQLVALGTYVRYGMPSLDRWAEQKFREVIERHLLDVSYIDLFLRPMSGSHAEGGFAIFDRKLDDTKAAMTREAKSIGYDAYSVALRTNLDFDEFRRKFHIAVIGETFRTSVPGYDAGLDIDVTARIDSEDAIRGLFRHNVDIKAVIAGEIRRVVGEVLSGTSPEEYYVYFRAPKERTLEVGGRGGGDASSGGPGHHLEKKRSLSVIETLEAAIKSLLQGADYGAHEISVRCTQQQTDLAKLFDDLRREQRTIEVVLERAQLMFDATLQVAAVALDYWNEFQRRPTIEMVESSVKRRTTEWLTGFSRDTLLQAPDEKLKGLLNDRALKDIESQLGLTTELVYFTRRQTPEEKTLVDIVIAERIRSMQEFEKTVAIRIKGLEDQLESVLAQAALRREAGEDREADTLNRKAEDLGAEVQELKRQTAFAKVTDVVASAAAASAKTLQGATKPALPGAPEAAPGLSEGDAHA